MNPLNKPNKSPLKSKSLMEAIFNGDLTEAEYWAIHKPLSVNQYVDHYSPLDRVLNVRAGIEFIELLVKHGAHVNQPDENGSTALHLACQIDRIEEMIECLLKHGADPSLKNAQGETAVHVAIYDENETVLKLLLRQGVDMTIRNDMGEDYLEYCIKYGGHDQSAAAMVTILIEHEVPLSHLESALKMRQGYPRLECYQIIEARVLVLKEQKSLEDIVESSVKEMQKTTHQEAVGPEEHIGSNDSRLSLHQKRGKRL